MKRTGAGSLGPESRSRANSIEHRPPWEGTQ